MIADSADAHGKAVMDKTFIIDGVEYGWFRARIRAEDRTIAVDASCFEDFVTDFMAALLRALDSPEGSAVCTEEQETQHVRWEIVCRRGRLLFTAAVCDVDCEMSRVSLEVGRDAFLDDFLGEFGRVLQTDGPQGFRDSWHHEFPAALYARLAAERRSVRR